MRGTALGSQRQLEIRMRAEAPRQGDRRWIHDANVGPQFRSADLVAHLDPEIGRPERAAVRAASFPSSKTPTAKSAPRDVTRHGRSRQKPWIAFPAPSCEAAERGIS